MASLDARGPAHLNPLQGFGSARFPIHTTTQADRERYLGWELPVGRGKSLLSDAGIVTYILGGWNLSTSYQGQGGHFLTPIFSGPDPSNTRTFGGLPDRIGNGNLLSDQRSVDRWFDASAFTVPPNGRFGNSGRGIPD